VYVVLLGKSKRKKKHLENLGADKSIIFKQNPNKYSGRTWTGFIWLRIGNNGGHFINTVMRFLIL
jgi:hypothetical protein